MTTSSYTLGEFAEDDSVHMDNWHLQKNLFTLYKNKKMYFI